MSDKQINKNGVASQMRAMFLILSMLFCAAIHANPEFQKYTYTDENGITISVSDPGMIMIWYIIPNMIIIGQMESFRCRWK